MKHPFERLRIEEHHGNKIIIVDYRGLREKAMIELVTRHYELTLEIKLSFLADFNDTYVTPNYMDEARKFVGATKSIIDKGALLGIDQVKAMILKGLLHLYPVNYRSFETRDEAIAFLTKNEVPKEQITDSTQDYWG